MNSLDFVVPLENWAVVLQPNQYCRAEEYDLRDLHLQGNVPMELLEDDPCNFCPYKNKLVFIFTTPIVMVKDGNVFVTQNRHFYRLGKPHREYARILGSNLSDEQIVNRMIDIVSKKWDLV